MNDVLFLDDDLERCKKARSQIPWADIVHTAVDCITKLEEKEYRVVFLDHDLGGEVYVDSKREDCGMEVVRWIMENRPKVGRFVVHTLNPAARERMFANLRECGYETHSIPFILFQQALDEGILMPG